MLSTSARLLSLLGLLQGRSSWTGPELAAQLAVGERTVRKDITRLRDLGYPVDAVRGRTGGYRLGVQGRLPPLLLDDDEAVAVAVALGAIGLTAPGLAETGTTALGKLERTLPGRLRRQLRALEDSTDVGPVHTGTNAADPSVDGRLLVELATAIGDHAGLRVSYRGERAELDPYRLVSWQQRWYVVARRRATAAWDAFRVDWLEVRVPGASRFTPDPLEGGDYSAFVLRQVASTGWSVHARIWVEAPAEVVLARINPAVGVVEAVDAEHCVLLTGADTWEVVAVWIGMLGLDFQVHHPPELVEHVAALAHRYAAALPR